MSITNDFKTDSNNNPAGGSSKGVGVEINWQDGPLGKSEVNEQGQTLADNSTKNGAFVEDVIEAAIARLEFFNNSKFRCRENSLAVTKLEEALHWLNSRTARRIQQGIEGTHTADPNPQT